MKLTHRFSPARSTAKRFAALCGVCLLLQTPLSAPLSALIPTYTAQTETAFAVTQSDVDAARKQLEDLNAQLTQKTEQLSSATDELEQLDYEIAQKEEEIAQTEQTLSEKRTTMNDYIRQNYKDGTSSVLDFLLGATSPEDLVSRTYYVSRVTERQAKLIAEVQTISHQLNEQKVDLQKSQAVQQSKVDALQNDIESYGTQIQDAQQLVNSLSEEVRQQLEDEKNAALSNVQEAVSIGGAAVEAAAAGTNAASAGNTTAAEQSGGQPTQSDTDSSSEAAVENNTNDQSSASSQPVDTTPTPASGGGLSTAYAALGKPYVYGASGPNSFDCSGLVVYCYGYRYGRTTYSMIAGLQAAGRWKTDKSQLAVGDLVFTGTGHVGIYIGNNQMIHAPYPGTVVQIATLWAFYGGGTY